MGVHQRIISLLVALLLLAALCPGAHSKGRTGKMKPKSSNTKLSKEGLKVAGAAAAAGLLGGAGTGVGAGLLGRGRGGSGRGSSSSSSKSTGYGHNDEHYYDGRIYHKYFNETKLVKYGVSAAPEPVSRAFHTLGHVACFLLTAWIGGI